MKINYLHTEVIHNSKAAREVLPIVFDLLSSVSSVADIGCGTGSWLLVAKELGAKRVLGVDGIYVDKTLLRISDDEFLQHNLTLPLFNDNKFDLAICLEVAEHLPENDADNLVNILTAFSDVILFSAGIPGQGGQFHLNEQWPSYWEQKFRHHDFVPIDNLRPLFWNNPNVNWWYKQNMLLYVRAEKADQLNLSIASAVPAYIHPELLNLKISIIEQHQQHITCLEKIVQNEIHKPQFIPSLKKVIKSIIR